MEEKFTWIETYNKIAHKLLEYKNNRQALVDIMYEILEDLNLFNEKDEINCNLDKYQNKRCKYDDIDPFTFMNRLALYSNENRKKFIKLFADKTKINLEIPKDFDGVPTVNAQKSGMVQFKDDRDENDIDEFWTFFEIALEFPKNPNLKENFIKYYDILLNKPNCGYNISSCLFRMDAKNYFSLDSTNRAYLADKFNLVIKEYPSGEKYLEILEKINEYLKNSGDYNSYAELSYEAWKVSRKNKTENRKELLDTMHNKDDREKRYFWLNANPKIWSFSEIKPGETIEYNSYNENNNKRRIFQRFEEAEVGDEVIAYETTPSKAIVGICKVDKSLKNNTITFKKVEQFSHPILFKDIKDLPELQNMEYFKNNQGSLFKVTNEEYNILMDIIREENPIVKKTYEKYNSDDFLNDVYMSKKQYEEIKSLIKEKQNIILEGSPGVGKTYMAKKLVYSLIGEKNDDQIEMIEFHQNYSYEDFIEGYRPNEDGKLEIEKGIFFQFCLTAENNPDKDFYLIIDEINRGNLSKIFGELLMLIEKDKRETSVTLAYSKVKFKVPKNLYLIGLMNTADRSIAIIDYALRRRFSFVDIMPAYENEKFKDYIASLNNEKLNRIIKTIKDLNKEISNDVSLGEEFMIGHSYFCNLTKENLYNKIDLIVKYEIKPLLKEYWFDNKEKLDEWKKKLEG